MYELDGSPRSDWRICEAVAILNYWDPSLSLWYVKEHECVVGRRLMRVVVVAFEVENVTVVGKSRIFYRAGGKRPILMLQ